MTGLVAVDPLALLYVGAFLVLFCVVCALASLPRRGDRR